MSAIAIIPARGGSRRLPGKNLLSFHGKPIIQYSIEAAREAQVFNVIAVSTDDMEIAAATHAMGCTVIWRPPNLCDDVTGTDVVMRSHLERLESFDHACCIYATAPLIHARDIKAAFQILIDRDPDYVFSMGIDPNQDAGQWYWATRDTWVKGKHFISPRSVMYPIAADRHCDINDSADWQRAEALYAKMMEGERAAA